MRNDIDGWNLSVRITLLPKDTNHHGTIFGGVILSYIDIAGAIEARRFCVQPVVTVAMKEVIFKEPVFLGDLVSFYTRIVSTGRTSVTIEVRVYSDRDTPEKGNGTVFVTNAVVTYVAINESRNPETIKIRTTSGEAPAFSPEYLEKKLRVEPREGENTKAPKLS